ncbi:hypothetical protein GGR56DRAFT_286110 [Xylariaceae sp. FL0804]|nr:hypothetical protein GGR56DRAFT_286110 [Xylariaceae sp. FL0804]
MAGVKRREESADLSPSRRGRKARVQNVDRAAVTAAVRQAREDLDQACESEKIEWRNNHPNATWSDTIWQESDIRMATNERFWSLNKHPDQIEARYLTHGKQPKVKDEDDTDEVSQSQQEPQQKPNLPDKGVEAHPDPSRAIEEAAIRLLPLVSALPANRANPQVGQISDLKAAVEKMLLPIYGGDDLPEIDGHDSIEKWCILEPICQEVTKTLLQHHSRQVEAQRETLKSLAATLRGRGNKLAMQEVANDEDDDHGMRGLPGTSGSMGN